MNEKTNIGLKSEVEFSLNKLEEWLIENDWEAYDPFEGLNSNIRPLTFENQFLRQVLIQFVKRVPINIRPLLGISPSRSTKGIAYIVMGDLKRYVLTKNNFYLNRAVNFLDWLIENSCLGYSGYCWGNHFDYQTRGYYLKKNNPTLVWSSLVARAFTDAYFLQGNGRYADVVDSTCKFIINDLPIVESNKGTCISYVSHKNNLVHNANLLGASTLAIGYGITGNSQYKEVAENAVLYSVDKQLENGAWYYGEELKYRWIDNWHTAYNLDSIKIYQDFTGDSQFSDSLNLGFNFYKENFFSEDGKPSFYHNKMYPIDIQCCSQAIDTLLLFGDCKDILDIAIKVADWTVRNMQSKHGFFYYQIRKHSTVKIPMFHWGQATMYHALANLEYHMENIQ